MDRQEKRMIRLSINDILESECKVCEYNLIGREGYLHCVRECPVGKNLQSLSNKLLEDKKGVRKRKVYEKEPEPYQRGPWSSDEEQYLINHVPYFKPMHIAKRLNRSPNTVYQKIYSLQKMGLC